MPQPTHSSSCAQDGTCSGGLACVAGTCLTPALGKACQGGTDCSKAHEGASCVEAVCATLPGAPRNVVATLMGLSATVTFAAPLEDSGLPTTAFIVRGSPGGITVHVSGTAMDTTVAGLSPKTTYTFTVSAVNAVGEGPQSLPSAPVTTVGPPDAPTAVTGAPGIREVVLSWAAPADNGGEPITSYRVTSDQGTDQTVPAAPTMLTVSGLSNGTSYVFTVTATNAIGTGPGATSAPVTTFDVPGMPTGLSATPGNRQIEASWSAPASNGGAPITGYVLSATAGTEARSLSLTGTTGTLTGLFNGRTYSVSVSAVNAVGRGPPATTLATLPCLRRGFNAPLYLPPRDSFTSQLLTADLNGDGTSDVLRVGAETEIILGTGDGDLRPSGSLPVGSLAKVAVADVNGDQKIDVLAVDGPVFSVYLGNGDATFQAPLTRTLLGGPMVLATGLIDGDNNVDVVAVLNFPHSLAILLGNGDGTFGNPTTVTTSEIPCDLAVGDLDGDGKTDLVVTFPFTPPMIPRVRLYRGSGTGSFTNQGYVETPDLETSARGVVIADVTADGKLDAVVLSTTGPLVLVGDGDGGLSAGASLPGGGALRSADLDGDGVLDLLTRGHAYFGAGDGGFSDVALPGSWTDVFPMQLNGDPYLDLAFRPSGNDGLGLARADAPRRWAIVDVRSVEDTGPHVLADVTSDGRADLLRVATWAWTANGFDAGLVMQQGLDDGGFGAVAYTQFGLASGSTLVCADFNRDGKMDVVTGGDPSLGSTLSVLWGDGTGTFAVDRVYLPFVSSASVYDEHDVDGDGRPDILAMEGGRLRVLQGQADGGFTAGWSVTGAAFSPSFHDFDGDGRVDVFYVNSDYRSVTRWHGLGDGSFDAGQSSPWTTVIYHARVADLTGDALLDVVATGDTLEIGIDVDGGPFQTRVIDAGVGFLTGTDVAVVDVNADNKKDLIIASGGALHVLLGDGAGGFSVDRRYFTGAGSRVSAVDLNGDGRVDLILSWANTAIVEDVCVQ